MDGASPLGFPLKYQIYLTNPQNSAWTDLGVFQNQPDSNGKVTINLPGTYSTWGIMIVPVTLSTDNFNSYYFQLNEIRFE